MSAQRFLPTFSKFMVYIQLEDIDMPLCRRGFDSVAGVHVFSG